MRNIAKRVAEGTLKPEDIDEQTIGQALQTQFMPDPELLIRTGGELRLSNFLLWQSAYSELYFTDVFWPISRPNSSTAPSPTTSTANGDSAKPPNR